MVATPNFGSMECPSSACGLRDSMDNNPFSIRFQAQPYSIFSESRDEAPDTGASFADITLPLPINLSRDNSIKYGIGETETGHMFDFTAGGFWESLKTGFGVVTAAKDLLGVGSLMGQRPMDMRDSIYEGVNFRTHKFSWKIIPKCEGDLEEITKICNAFQTCSYPMMSGFESASRVIHPPVWHITGMGIGVSKKEMEERWTFKMLPSVLTEVRIDTTPDGTWAFQGGYPAVSALSVSFQELEPAVAAGNEIKSRSQVK